MCSFAVWHYKLSPSLSHCTGSNFSCNQSWQLKRTHDLLLQSINWLKKSERRTGQTRNGGPDGEQAVATPVLIQLSSLCSGSPQRVKTNNHRQCRLPLANGGTPRAAAPNRAHDFTQEKMSKAECPPVLVRLPLPPHRHSTRKIPSLLSPPRRPTSPPPPPPVLGLRSGTTPPPLISLFSSPSPPASDPVTSSSSTQCGV